MKHEEATSPVSFKANVARLPQKGMPVVIDADERQRQALARIHGLESVEHYRAELLVSPWNRNGVQIEGSVRAKITQSCVVTLDPIQSTIDETVEGLFLPEESKLGKLGIQTSGEIVLDVDGPDSPETFSGDWIDVGARAEEFFGLAIDPYPRKSDASQVVPDGDPEPASQLQEKLRLLTRKT